MSGPPAGSRREPASGGRQGGPSTFADGAAPRRGRVPGAGLAWSAAVQPEEASRVEVKIGVQHSPRELVVDSPNTPEEIAAAVASAMSGGTKDGLLTLEDDRGRRVLVPVDRIAYVEIAQPDQRRVGFVSGN
nr:DUF3107 domain-containing protein [Geodermatophilus normandii]